MDSSRFWGNIISGFLTGSMGLGFGLMLAGFLTIRDCATAGKTTAGSTAIKCEIIATVKD